MVKAWTGKVVGRMHVLGVSHKEMANRVGVTNRYLSMVLNGHRDPKGAEEKLNGVLDEIERERNAESEAAEEAE